MTRLIETPARGTLRRALRRLIPHFGATSKPPISETFHDDDVSDLGERTCPEDNNFCFYAHQSIYAFAQPFAQNRRVLDAGCGTGYGSHLLKDSGAKSVLGIDLSAKAVRHCRERYGRDGLDFEAMDLQELTLRDEKFGLIFCSNVLEHVPDADAFLDATMRLLEPGGVFVLAVPTIVTIEALEANLENRYHVNNITPKAWSAKLGRYFEQTQGYRHWVKPEWIDDENGMYRSDDAIRARDFTFPERTTAEMMAEEKTITTIIVARNPRRAALPKTAAESEYPADWDLVDGRPRQAPEGIVGPIMPDRRVVQTFRPAANGLRRIDVMMGTYGRVNQSTLLVQIRYDSIDGQVILELGRKCSEIHDGDWNAFEFYPIGDSQDRTIALVFQLVEDWPKDSITAYYTSQKFAGAEQLAVNWLPHTGALQMRPRTESPDYPADWDLIGALLPDRPVTQVFRSDEDRLRGVEVQMATYGRINTSRIRATLRRESLDGEILAVTEFPAAEVRDNEWNAFTFPEVADSLGKIYAITFDSPDATPANAVTAYCTEDPNPIEQGMRIQHLPFVGSLRFRPLFTSK